MGDNLFLETAASGPAIDGNPGAEGFGNLQQSYLEEANVNAVPELSSLIAAQRAYERNAKVVTADQMLSSSTQMMRGEGSAQPLGRERRAQHEAERSRREQDADYDHRSQPAGAHRTERRDRDFEGHRTLP